MKCLTTLILSVTLWTVASSQDLQYFFVKDVFQRSYINPALNKQHTISVASGFMTGLGTDGPVYTDLVLKNDQDRYVINAANAVADMGERHNIYSDAAVHLLDLGLDLKVMRLSVGQAWKASGWLQYSRDLAEVGTFGNAPYIGEAKSIGPQFEYINYNELYLGMQRYIGPVSVGVKLKRLSGVQALQTVESRIDVTTGSDFYALTVDSDYTVNSSGTLSYFALDSLDFDIRSISYDNFMSANGGWAVDLGASFDLGDRLELSVSMLDIGSITWDEDATNLRSDKVQTFDGLDLSSYIGSDDQLVVEDSLRALLDFEETATSFKTTLPAQIYIGARLRLSDLWTVGALIHTMKYGDVRRSAFALNATTKISIFDIGMQYTARSESLFNIGLNGSAKIGPVTGFFAVDNVLVARGFLENQHSNVRLGLSLGI